MRLKKLKGDGIILKAARHNLREIQSELGAEGSIDPMRSNLNYSLAGPPTAAGVAALAKDLVAAAGVGKLRKDAVLGIEVVFSLPVGHRLDTQAYFADCVAWAGGYFGGVANILSADVHLDEGADHCHVLILPLVGSRMDGSNMMGARAKLLAMQSQFFEGVAKRHGLSKAPARLSGTGKQAAAAMVLARLRKTNDAALQSAVWASLRDLIESAPEPFMVALGLVLIPKKKQIRTMAQIFTSTGAGPKQEPKAQNSIGFAQDDASENPIGFANQANIKKQNLCSVGFAQNPPLQTHPKQSKQAQPSPDSHEHQEFAEGSMEITAADASTTTGTPDEHGEIAAPAPTTTQHQPDKDGEDPQQPGRPDRARNVHEPFTTGLDATAVERTPPNGGAQRPKTQAPTKPLRSREQERHQESRKATETTRERDEDHESGHWCCDTGEFVAGTPSATRPARRAMRDAADDWVMASLGARGKMADGYTARL